jgi:phage terminase large subunit GpA-like protein
VRQWLAAVDKARAGDKSELKTFVNTTLGESYEEEAERADEHELQRRAEDYPLRTVPDGGLVLVCGVDVQDDRFECVVWAIGRGEEMWAVDYTVLTANPADERDWEKLDSYLKTSFRHASGIGLKIEAAGIDTGGHFTHQAYAFCRTRTSRRIYAIKGDHREGQPVKGRSSMQDVNWRGKIIKAGVKLWHVGTDTAKDLLFGRLKVTLPGPGYVHFSRYLAPEFFTQITSESRMLQRTARGEMYRWVKRGAVRNEVLDATVYALFASHMRDVHKYTDGMWHRLRAKLLPEAAPVMPEEVEEPAPAPMVVPPAPAAKWMPTRNRGSRFSSWYRG